MQLRAILPVALIALASCRESREVGPPVEDGNGSVYVWMTGDDAGVRVLVRRTAEGEAPESIDEGVFANVLGPVPTEGGVAWAVSDPSGEWRIREVGASGLFARRGQGAGGPLQAAWALERIRAGHPPGDAADLEAAAALAATGEWPAQ